MTVKELPLFATWRNWQMPALKIQRSKDRVGLGRFAGSPPLPSFQHVVFKMEITRKIGRIICFL